MSSTAKLTKVEYHNLAVSLAVRFRQDKTRLLIERTPDVIGGQFRVKGTRISVAQIYDEYLDGRDPEIIASSFEGLSFLGVQHAIAFGARYRPLIEKEQAYRRALEGYQKELSELAHVEG